MTDLRAAAQQALEAWDGGDTEWFKRAYTVMENVRAALAEPVQEPVAIVGTQEDTWKGYGDQWLSPGPPIKTVHMLAELPVGTPLYTAPPQRKPLDDLAIADIYTKWDEDKGWGPLVEAIEQALKEKNNV